MYSIVNIGVLLLLTITITHLHGDSTVSDSATTVSTVESTNKDECDVDEEYDECGSTCARSCCDLFYPRQYKKCSQRCVPGCFCKIGLYRARNGRCVKPDECCQGKNEHYATCGTFCPEICNYKSQLCTRQCVPGCFCNTGYIRADNTTNSPCIRPDQCETDNLVF